MVIYFLTQLTQTVSDSFDPMSVPPHPTFLDACLAPDPMDVITRPFTLRVGRTSQRHHHNHPLQS
jgi:hypothetical protein